MEVHPLLVLLGPAATETYDHVAMTYDGDGHVPGFVVTVWDQENLEFPILEPTGFCHPEEEEVAGAAATEVARRLIRHLSDGHVTSRQNREPGQQLDAAAIYIVSHGIVIAVAGYDELRCEFAAVMIAQQLPAAEFILSDMLGIGRAATPEQNHHLVGEDLP